MSIVSFSSCYAECASLTYPSYFPTSGNIIPVFPFYNATQILATLLLNNGAFHTFCFMPGVYWINQSLTDMGGGNIYLYGCTGSEIRTQSVGHFQLFYWRAASNIVIDHFYLNCLYYNSTLSFGLDATSGNANVMIKNNWFVSKWEGDSVHGQGASGFGVNQVTGVWMLNNTLISTIQFGAATAFGCNYCNYTIMSFNTVINYSSGFQGTAASNYGFNWTIEHNYVERNPPIQTQYTGFVVGISVFGTQLYTVIRNNKVVRSGYALDMAGNTPGWDGNNHQCITDTTNPAYNSRCLEFFNCASCGPVIQNNTLIDYQVGIESGTPFTNMMYNTFLITSGYSGSFSPISLGCAPSGVYQFNNFTFQSPNSPSYQIITNDGQGDTSYCCMNRPQFSQCAYDPGFVVGLNVINGVNQWGFVDPQQGVPSCCANARFGYCSGSCNAVSGWNTSWNFAGAVNSNLVH